MYLPLFPSKLKAILLCILLPLASPLILDPFPSLNLTLDYGRIIEKPPIAALSPTSPQDISLLLNSISSSPTYNKITIAPRGAGHSTYGQAQAPGGIVVNMTSLPKSIVVSKTYVDAGGGALWVDVLKQTLKHGLAPRSWTDYLYLTVGGTLSVGGISGQAFKHGPQISNVIELDVVTGTGDHVTCSREKNSDLFYGVLGGLGQLGIITRARIILEHAPKMVKWITVAYSGFDQFTRDQELIISNGEVDYLEGFIKFKDEANHLSNAIPSRLRVDKPIKSDVYYLIEIAIYYDHEGTILKAEDRILSQLDFTAVMVDRSDVSYFEFLNRVRAEELDLRKRGLWEVAHPWLNLFVPRAHIRRFKDLLLKTISDDPSDGPMIVYPTLRWDKKMLPILPPDTGEDIVYVVSILRSAPPSCKRDSPCIQALLRQNQNILDIATSEPDKQKAFLANATAIPWHLKTSMHGFTRVVPIDVVYDSKDISKVEQEGATMSSEGGMGAKQYMPYWNNEREWRVHFGDKWEWFKELKRTFDPLNILTPGQRIFRRKRITS